MPLKICRRCRLQKEEETEFCPNTCLKKGIRYVYRRAECRTCTSEYSRKYAQDHKDKAVFFNCRRYNKSREIETDITIKDIQELLTRPCQFCDETDLTKVKVDRKESQKGFTRKNIISCCIRCSRIKQNMPYKAWLVILPGIRIAKFAGLFGDWIPPDGSARRLKKNF